MYNQNAALRQGTFVSTFHGEFVQYAVNKVGFNVRTLDWVDTCFSDVGMIAVVTPGIKERRKVTPGERNTSSRAPTAEHENRILILSSCDL